MVAKVAASTWHRDQITTGSDQTMVAKSCWMSFAKLPGIFAESFSKFLKTVLIKSIAHFDSKVKSEVREN